MEDDDYGTVSPFSIRMDDYEINSPIPLNVDSHAYMPFSGMDFDFLINGDQSATTDIIDMNINFEPIKMLKKTLTAPVPTLMPMKQTNHHEKMMTKPVKPFPRAKSNCTPVFKTGQNTRPIILPSHTPEDQSFSSACCDHNRTLNVRRLGFLPQSYWPDEEFSFGDIVRDFFQRKNNPNCRFNHKLYNALVLTYRLPEYLPFIGVEWLSVNVIKVQKTRFARLLGISSIDGSFFHQQGNFPAFGFIELKYNEVVQLFGQEFAANNDFDEVHLLTHEEGVFTQNCTEETLMTWKWQSAKVRNI